MMFFQDGKDPDEAVSSDRLPIVTRFTSFLPAAVVTGTLAALLSLSGTNSWLALWYLVAFLWSVTLPGGLVYRFFRGRPSSLVTELGLASTVGLGVQLAAWWIFTAAGLAAWQGCYPIFFLAGFWFSPARTKVFSTLKYPNRLGPINGWLLAFAVLFPLVVRTVWFDTALPPEPINWYQDLLWVLGGVNELMRTVSPVNVQAATLPFDYHWYSQAHMAAMSQITGLSPTLIIARFWAIPLIIAMMAVLVEVGRFLTNKYWPGALSAMVVAVGGSLTVTDWFNVSGLQAFGFYSPSQLYAICLITAGIYESLALLSGQIGRYGWVPYALIIVASAGAKSSSLPLFIAAGCLALFVAFWQRDTWRQTVWTVIAPGLGLVITMVSGEGAAGSRFQLFSTVAASSVFTQYFGRRTWDEVAAPIIPHLNTLRGLGMLAFALGLYLVAMAWLWTARFAPIGRRFAWLAGFPIGGFAAAMVINHPGQSQLYFLGSAIPAAAVLAAWGTAVLWEKSATIPNRINLVALGAGLGLTWLALAHQFFPLPPAPLIPKTLIWFFAFALTTVAVIFWISRKAPSALAITLASGLWTATLASQILQTLGVARWWVCAALAVIAFVIWLKPYRQIFTTLTGVTVIALIGLSIPAKLSPAATKPEAKFTVTSDEVIAAEWLKANASPFDMAATNVHCASANSRNYCDSRAFWVSGLSGVRFLIESWAYTTPANLAHGKDGKWMGAQPYHDPKLYALNESAFYHPTAAVLAELREKYHVRWLFADSRHREFVDSDNRAHISTDLDKYATRMFTSGPVTIYRLDP